MSPPRLSTSTIGFHPSSSSHAICSSSASIDMACSSATHLPGLSQTLCHDKRHYNRGFGRWEGQSVGLLLQLAEVDPVSPHFPRTQLTLSRTYDSPSFTLQTFVPPSARTAYLAIRAFNIDIARIADATSNPIVGRMRMQFWRDAITRALAGNPPKEPVAVLLAHALESLQSQNGSSGLSKSWFLRVINEREKALGNPPYPSLAALERYAENTYATLLYLTLQAVPLASVTVDHLASHIGKAIGIAAVLRGVPLVAFPPPSNHHSNQAEFGGGSQRQGAVLLPLDVMAEHGVKEEEVLRHGAQAAGLRDAVFAVATRANDHLITARAMLANLRAGGEVDHDFEHAHEEEHRYSPAQLSKGVAAQLEDVDKGFGVLMPAVAAGLWLERLQKVDFDVFDPSLRTTDWKLPWKAYWAFKRRRL